MAVRYLPRLIDGLLVELLADFPALMIVGARATGKTTTAARHAAMTLRLDRPGVAAVVDADPDAALRELAEPVLIDEWQLAPTVLGAVKRAVDSDSRPGRFIITGSVEASLRQESWPGTGRLIHLEMGGLTARELLGADLTARPFLERVAAEGTSGLRVPADPPDLRSYIELALRGGFPELALGLNGPRARQRWASSYLGEVFNRDADHADGGRDPVRLRRFFEAYSVNTAGVVPDTTLAEAAGLDRRTAEAYERLLRNLYILQPMSSWSSNRLKRLVRMPKRFVTDPALAAAALHVTDDDVMQDGNVLGRLLETFVVAQIRAELPLGDWQPRLYHLRDQNGAREIDLIADFGMRGLVAIEIKSHSAPARNAARHLMWLREQIGDAFIAGVVLHTGPGSYPLGERITAAPIATLWS